MKPGEPVFVDSGAWIALALTRDPMHARAKDAWSTMSRVGVRCRTSVAVVVETFTFLDRHATPAVAHTWRQSLERVPHFRVLGTTAADLQRAWPYFDRNEFHKLSAVDALSFALMKTHGIRRAFAFDVHFSVAGFDLVG